MNKQQIKVVNKGYTIAVKSYEGEYDYVNTISKTVETLDEVKMLHELMSHCISICDYSNSEDFVTFGGGSDSYNDKQLKFIVDFFTKHSTLLNEDLDDIDYVIDCFNDLLADLLGYSDYDGYIRVVESITVTYSPTDIYCDEITF